MKNDDSKPNKDTKQEKKHTECEEEIEVIKEQVTEVDNKYKRALADYQNLQRRVADERSDWIRAANRELLLRILTVYDTLELATKHNQDETLKVCLNQFNDILKAEGVTKIETVGKEFNPHLMEAIAAGEGEDGIVVDEIRSGFLLNDKLLRAAQVKVGRSEQKETE